jgi:hypothetical protein
MAEVLTNGTFTGSITGWTKWGGSSTEMFVYDATGAGHDGGAAKASDGGVNTTARYSMYQAFTLTNAADINTSTVDAWIKHTIGSTGSNVIFKVHFRDPDEVWHTTHIIQKTSSGSTTWLTDSDVKSTLQAGGNGEWYFGVVCIIYRPPGSVAHSYGWFDDLSLDIVYHAYGSTTETITLTDTSSDSMALSDSATETIIVSDSGTGTFGSGSGTPEDPEDPDPLIVYSADPVFRYYFGSYEGKVYAEESVYKSDGDASIDAYWESKETDFAEEGMDSHDRFKTIYKVRLWYVDISDNPAPITLSIKPDGGATWTTIAVNIGGTGDDTTKSKDFYIIKSGHSFKFRIEHNSVNNEFQWSALEVFYTLGGDYFQ